MVLKNILSGGPPWVIAALMAFLGLALGFTLRAFGVLDGPLGAAVMVSVVMALGFVGAISYWRRLDEAAREAHKFAWYWGGSFGMAVAIVLAVAMTRVDVSPLLTDLAGGTEPSDYAGFGMLAAMGLQAAFYFVAWAGWWISKR